MRHVFEALGDALGVAVLFGLLVLMLAIPESAPDPECRAACVMPVDVAR